MVDIILHVIYRLRDRSVGGTGPGVSVGGVRRGSCKQGVGFGSGVSDRRSMVFGEGRCFGVGLVEVGVGTLKPVQREETVALFPLEYPS